MIDQESTDLGTGRAIDSSYAVNTLSGLDSIPSLSKNKVNLSFDLCIPTDALLVHLKCLRYEYISKLAKPIVLRLYSHPRNAGIFNDPVDPVSLKIPAYFSIIKNPMDLGTIKERLQCSYYDTIENLFYDLRLVFHNAIKFNGTLSLVGTVAQELLNELDKEIASLEEKTLKANSRKSIHSCSHCCGSVCHLCGEKCLKFESAVLFCHNGSCGQKIKKNSPYFVSPDGLWVWCQKCFQGLPRVLIGYGNTQILKRNVLKRKYDEEVSEPWVQCDHCGKWCHNICAYFPTFHELDHTKSKSFSCLLCSLSRADYNIPLSINCSEDECSKMWSARSLPRTQLSDFLESLLQELLVAQGHSDYASSIVIRVTSNINGFTEVPEQVVDLAHTYYQQSVPQRLPHRQKCIQLFQTIDGVDVFLFCLYVQEFDRDCPSPNTSSVYISYIDSVDYFRPLVMRSLVYQELVAGYLAWVRARGFRTCHIWACPPQRGDNFIFWCHPQHQKTPSRDRLSNWYQTMLARCNQLGLGDSVDHFWNVYFSNLHIREEKHASKRLKFESKSFPNKRTKQSDNESSDFNHATNCTDIVLLEETATNSIFQSSFNYSKKLPPIFEGDYWAAEYVRLLVNHVQRSQDIAQLQLSSNYRKCRDIVKSLINKPHAAAFRQPVDPDALNIPTYFNIIKNPMDLGTIREKLRADVYRTVHELVEDVRLTFRNAKTFNPPGHPIHCFAQSLLEDFERWTNDVYQSAKELMDSGLQQDEVLKGCLLSVIAPASHRGNDDDFAKTSISENPTQPSTSNNDDNGLLKITPRQISRVVSNDALSDIVEPPKCDDNDNDKSFWVEDAAAEADRSPSFSSARDSSVRNATLSMQKIIPILIDLSKAVHRINDDLFVVKLASSPAVVEESSYKEECGSKNSIKVHLRPKKAVLSYFPSASFMRLSKVIADTSDPDPILSSPIMDSRYTFLEMCQYRHFQFDSLRRAKHSSLMVLYYLHNPEKYCGPVCCICTGKIQGIRWHCDQCVDFDICNNCKVSKSSLPTSIDSDFVPQIQRPDCFDCDERFDSKLHPHPLSPYRVTIVK